MGTKGEVAICWRFNDATLASLLVLTCVDPPGSAAGFYRSLDSSLTKVVVNSVSPGTLQINRLIIERLKENIHAHEGWMETSDPRDVDHPGWESN